MPSPRRVASLALTFAAVSPDGGSLRAANDNRRDAQHDALLRAALRMFAEHGLGAGHRAQGAAEDAFFAGDRDRYRWWLSVTRTLDRKLAVELAGRMGSDKFGTQHGLMRG